MTSRKAIVAWAILAVVVAGTVVAIVRWHRMQRVTLRGAVLRQDPDPNKQLPLADVQITAVNSLGNGSSKSNSSGFFSLKLPRGFRRRQPVRLEFRRDDYQPLNLDDFVGDTLYIARMVPIHQDTKAESRSGSGISNARIRYSVKTITEANIGSTVKTFQVINVGNKPCENRPPCGGKWKAAIGSLALDAGKGNEFRNARVSCIAGPCPFTKVEQESLSEDGRYLKVAARNWSDTTTFLVEADVVHPMTSDMVRETYPVIFGRAMNFSLPASAEGPSIEAEVDGEATVFPLGPDLLLRWADCHMEIDKDQSRTYRCVVKPGYQFR